MSAEALLERFTTRYRSDPALRHDSVPFANCPWKETDDGAIERWHGDAVQRVEQEQILIRHKNWPGSKRIPLK